ncbi:hypothetical protein G6F31_021385 [Rhizopus arrhizus]|nr:hypothetical protein G6F31_021385 [Rhizopus arrhizus]
MGTGLVVADGGKRGSGVAFFAGDELTIGAGGGQLLLHLGAGDRAGGVQGRRIVQLAGLGGADEGSGQNQGGYEGFHG